MPPAEMGTRTERPERAAVVDVAPSAKVPLFSPAGYVVVLIILIIEGVLVYTISNFFGQPSAPDEKKVAVNGSVVEVELGSIEISFDKLDSQGATLETRRLVIEPVLYLDSSRKNIEESRRYADSIKAKLRNIVRDMLKQKGFQELHQPSTMSGLKMEIKDRLNKELKADVISEVVYNEELWR